MNLKQLKLNMQSKLSIIKYSSFSTQLVSSISVLFLTFKFCHEPYCNHFKSTSYNPRCIKVYIDLKVIKVTLKA